MSLHDRIIRDLRKLGKIPKLGTLTRARLSKSRKEKAYLSENGSVLPNRFACWDYPFHTVIDKDI